MNNLDSKSLLSSFIYQAAELRLKFYSVALSYLYHFLQRLHWDVNTIQLPLYSNYQRGCDGLK